MIDLLTVLLRIAGAGLLTLGLMHVPIGRRLRWKEDSLLMSPVNGAIFRVHGFFIGFVLLLMALPCLLDPSVFLVPSRAALWGSWSLAAFWTVRLYCQWFVYAADLWRGKRLETLLHGVFTLVWLSLAVIFVACGCVQAGWRGF